MQSNSVADRALLEENLEELYEDAPCGYLTFFEDGIIAKVNRTLLKWLGYEASEIVNKKRLSELLNMGGRIFFETHFAPLLKMQGFANEFYFDLVKKNGNQISVLTSAVRRKSENEHTAYRMTVFDITDRKKYERELLAERQKAENATRTKANFLSMMTHEIRTPMNAVIGAANLMERTQLTGQQAEYMSMLKSSSENLLHLLNSILEFGKIESGKMALEEKNFELKKFLENVVRGLAGQAQEKGLFLNINISPEIPDYVIGDPIKISQVLNNFVSNAIKFTEKGSVDINVLSLIANPNEAHLCFEVTDTGIGIAPDRLPRIFDEFTQANYEIGLKYGGSGLGLAISHKLVEAFGGIINVESELGHGSKFSFNIRLKIGEPIIEEAELSQGIEESGILSGLRILAADDSEDNLYILESFLNKWQVNLTTVNNGRDAVDLHTKSPFDLILMDLKMPVLDGYAATALIREVKDEKISQVPIIAFSASNKNDEEGAIEISAFSDSLQKPFKPKDLFSKIAYYTGRSQTSVNN